LGLFGAASAGFNHPEVVNSDGTPPAEVVEAEWTRIEKSSLRRAVFSRVSEQLAKPAAHLLRHKPAVNGKSHKTEASHEPEPPHETKASEIASAQPIEEHRSGGMILIVNRAESVMRDCAVCGGGLASTPQGERLLLANVTDTASYLICAKCGDSIMAHVHAGEAAERYAWDWAIPLRESCR
jgi:hypothetical protein